MKLECVGVNKVWCENHRDWFYCMCDKCVKLNKKEGKNETTTTINSTTKLLHDDATTSGKG